MKWRITFPEKACADERLVFITSKGKRWADAERSTKDGVPDVKNHKGGIGKEFDRILCELDASIPMVGVE